MIPLTDDQRQTLAEPEPLVFDPRTNETYVLVRKDVYDRMKRLLASDEDPEGMYPLLADLDSADWEDLSAYGIHP